MNYQAQQRFATPGAVPAQQYGGAPGLQPQTFPPQENVMTGAAPGFGQPGMAPSAPGFGGQSPSQPNLAVPPNAQQPAQNASLMPSYTHGSATSLSSMNSPQNQPFASGSGTISPNPAARIPPPSAPPANTSSGGQVSTNPGDYEHLRPKHSDRGWNDPPSQLFHGGAQAASTANDKKKKRYIRPPTDAAHTLMYGGSGQSTPYGTTTPQASPMSMHNAQFQPMPGQAGQPMPGQGMPGQPMTGQGMPGQPMGMGQDMPGQPMGMGQGVPGQPMPGQQGYGGAPQLQVGYAGAQPSPAPNGYGMAHTPGAPAYGQGSDMHHEAAQSAGYGQYAGFPSQGVAPSQGQWGPR